jgi:hypothetical protein
MCVLVWRSSSKIARYSIIAVRVAVLLHHARVVDGDIVSTLLKAGLGIATRFKERIDQVVCFSDGQPGMIEEAGLDGLPFGSKALPLGNAEFPDSQP